MKYLPDAMYAINYMFVAADGRDVGFNVIIEVPKIADLFRLRSQLLQEMAAAEHMMQLYTEPLKVVWENYRPHIKLEIMGRPVRLQAVEQLKEQPGYASYRHSRGFDVS